MTTPIDFPASQTKSSNTDWFAKAGYGLALHWTTQSLPRGKEHPLPFKLAVEKFDISRLVEQCVEAGAGWLLFTISHGHQHLPFPSQTLDGVLPGRTCERDLMGELADALAPHGIPLIFYYPSVADDADPDWQRASGWLYKPASYTALQYEIVKEIGDRYGTRLAGWWIDNCYDPLLIKGRWQTVHYSVKSHADLYDFQKYADVLRQGNADRLVTFNFAGTLSWLSVLGKGIVDYAAGESDQLDRVPTGRFSGEGDSQWHSFVWMDDFWVHDKPGDVASPRYETEQVISYINYVRQYGGAFSYGAAPYLDEGIAEPTMVQLRELKKRLRGAG